MKTTAQKLRHAIRLLEKGWTKYCLSRDKDGNSVWFKSKRAVNFCLLGACRRAEMNEKEIIKVVDCISSKNRKFDGQWRALAHYNDYIARSRKQPIAVLRQALADLP